MPPTPETVRAAFEVFDTNRDGRLSQAELRGLLCRPTSGAIPLTDEQLEQVFQRFDANNDGFFSIDELTVAWSAPIGIEQIAAQASPDPAQHARPEGILEAGDGLSDPVSALDFELSTPMLVMTFATFKSQGRIFKSVKAWREEALCKGWLIKHTGEAGKVVIFISHTWWDREYLDPSRDPNDPYDKGGARLPDQLPAPYPYPLFVRLMPLCLSTRGSMSDLRDRPHAR